MREGWNVMEPAGADGKGFTVLAAGVDRAAAIARAGKALASDAEKVYVVRAAKVVILDRTDLKAALPKGVL